MSDRQKIYFALLASALLHALMGLFLFAWARLHPMGASPALPSLEQLEVTLMPAPTPVPLEIAANTAPTPPPKKTTRSTLDTEGLQETEKPPDNPVFESDINSRAASELPATGNAPLPSQEGKQRPFDNFRSQNYSLGKGEQAAPPVPPSPPKPEPRPVTPKEQSVAAPPAPRPTPLSRFTPVPATTPADAIALGKPTPVPASTAPSIVKASATPQQIAKLMPTPALRASTEAPRPATRDPGYRPHLEQNKIEGGISNRGKSGVDAVATPLGRYKKSLADAIGSRWYFYINNRMDLITVGDVHIKFYVNQQGRAENVRILSNTANETFGSYCIQSITEAKIPPLPPDVAPALEDGRLEVDYHFNIYPQ